jgi:DNA-binding NarL/FixJ family response regulator
MRDAMGTAIKLAVVDDHPLVRMGLSALFGTTGDVVVVGEGESCADAVALVRRARPDVILMDVRLPDGSGVEACRDIRSEAPSTRVVMLTSYADDEAVAASIVAGAAGYLLKQTDPSRVIEAVRAAARGDSLLDPRVTAGVLARIRRLEHGGGPTDPLAGLSDQERKILPLIAAGKTNRQIASELYLSEHTVKTYVSTLLRKLQLTRRAEAAAFIARQQSALTNPAD